MISAPRFGSSEATRSPGARPIAKYCLASRVESSSNSRHDHVRCSKTRAASSGLVLKPTSSKFASLIGRSNLGPVIANEFSPSQVVVALSIGCNRLRECTTRLRDKFQNNQHRPAHVLGRAREGHRKFSIRTAFFNIGQPELR